MTDWSKHSEKYSYIRPEKIEKQPVSKEIYYIPMDFSVFCEVKQHVKRLLWQRGSTFSGEIAYYQEEIDTINEARNFRDNGIALLGFLEENEYQTVRSMLSAYANGQIKRRLGWW